MKKSYYLFTLCIVILINLVNYCQDTRRSFTEPNVVYVGWEIGKYSPDSAGVTDAMTKAADLQALNHQIITVDFATGVYDLGMGQLVLKDSVYVRWGLGLVMSSDNPGGTVIDDSLQVYSIWEGNPTLINTDSTELNINLKNAGTIINRPGMTGYRPYKVYTALLSQTGTDAPVATVLENTLGGEVVWTRPSAGAYYGTLAGAFQSGKVYVTFAHFFDNGGVIEPIWVIVTNDYITIGGDNNVEMYDWRGAQTGAFFQIEIRVYP